VERGVTIDAFLERLAAETDLAQFSA
jgi:hypothetical protein